MKNNISKWMACCEFFDKLSAVLIKGYEVVGSCNQDNSQYLVPKGTADQITYSGKPAASFRISNHWNWYANINKCPNENYIQCLSVDAPWAKKRMAEGKPSEPIFCSQVAVIGNDGKYHVVYGERFDRKTKKWQWVESTPEEVVWNYL